MAYCHGTYFLAAPPIGDTPITPLICKGKENFVNQKGKRIKKQLKNTNRKREVGINIRVTPDEKAQIRAIAKAYRISISELIRQLVAGQQVHALPPEVFYETKDVLRGIEYCLLEHEITPRETLNAVKSCIAEFETIVKNFYFDKDGSFAKQYCDRVHQKWETEAGRFGD